MGYAGTPEYCTALDTAMGRGLTIDLGLYGLEPAAVLEFQPISYGGLAELMMLRRSSAHYAYERTSQKLLREGEGIDYRLRASDLNVILFGKGPQDLVSILLDPALAPKVIHASLRKEEAQPGAEPAAKRSILGMVPREPPMAPERKALIDRILGHEATVQAVMFFVYEVTTGQKAAEDPTREEAPKRSDPTTQPPERASKTGDSTSPSS